MASSCEVRLHYVLREPLFSQAKPCSIYFGGGTPSLLGPQNIQKILSWVQPSSCEITLEANPEDITLELMQDFHKIGINRVSLGIQTLDDTLLSALGRSHTSEQACKAVETVHKTEISNISVDLMYDLPHQTLTSWESTLEGALSLPVTHLSLYNLTLEPHTFFYKTRETLRKTQPDDKTSLAMLRLADERAKNAGLDRYEISAFARESYSSKHNSGYWTGRAFLGLGPSAYSFWDKSRFRNVANLQKYCKRLAEGDSAVDYIETLSSDAQSREQLVIGLRMLKGLPLTENILPETLLSIEKLQKQGLLKKTDNRLTLTDKGILFYDHVATVLI